MPRGATAGWLAERPIAHRGLHDGVSAPENTLAAAEAAVAAGYAIEIDVRLTADLGVVAFHDETLERLTGRKKRIFDLTLQELAGERIAGAHPIPTLDTVLAAVGSKVPVLIEVKSPRAFEPMAAIVARVIGGIRRNRADAAIMSFDPDILALARRGAPDLARGIIASRFRPGSRDVRPRVIHRFALANLLHMPRTRPAFVAYRVDDLPQASVSFARRRGLKVLGWTVRSAAQAARAHPFVDQIIFEDYQP